MDADKFLLKYSGGFSTDQSTSFGGPVSQVEPTYLDNIQLGGILSGTPAPGITVLRVRRPTNSGSPTDSGPVSLRFVVSVGTTPVSYNITCYIQWYGEATPIGTVGAVFDSSYQGTVKTVLITRYSGSSEPYLIVEINFNNLVNFSTPTPYVVEATKVSSSSQNAKSMGGYLSPMRISSYSEEKEFPAADYIKHNGAIRLVYANDFRSYSSLNVSAYSLRFRVVWGVGSVDIEMDGTSHELATLPTLARTLSLSSGIKYLYFEWPLYGSQAVLKIDTDALDSLVYTRNGAFTKETGYVEVFLEPTPPAFCVAPVYVGFTYSIRGYYAHNISGTTQSLVMQLSSNASTSYEVLHDAMSEGPVNRMYVGDGVSENILTSPTVNSNSVTYSEIDMGSVPSGDYLGFWLGGRNSFAGPEAQDDILWIVKAVP